MGCGIVKRVGAYKATFRKFNKSLYFLLKYCLLYLLAHRNTVLMMSYCDRTMFVEHCASTVEHRAASTICFIWQLLLNAWANFSQTSQECYLGDSLRNNSKIVPHQWTKKPPWLKKKKKKKTTKKKTKTNKNIVKWQPLLYNSANSIKLHRHVAYVS